MFRNKCAVSGAEIREDSTVSTTSPAQTSCQVRLVARHGPPNETKAKDLSTLLGRSPTAILKLLSAREVSVRVANSIELHYEGALYLQWALARLLGVRFRIIGNQHYDKSRKSCRFNIYNHVLAHAALEKHPIYILYFTFVSKYRLSTISRCLRCPG